MSSLSHHLDSHPGRNTAQVIATGREFYRALMTGFNSFVKTGLTWIILVLAFPFLFAGIIGFSVLFLIFLFQVKRSVKILEVESEKLSAELAQINSNLKGGNPINLLGPQIDHNAYAKIRQGQDFLMNIEKKLAGLDRPEPEALPSFLYWILSPIGDFYVAFSKYNHKLEELLELLDKMSPEGEWFETISGKDLWQNRNKAYEYLL